ncbi:MAG: hypothetical protein LH615_06590 [Ferruginibacter sp.]|nr:hypothetical protein [Ferruginibacter sp.]
MKRFLHIFFLLFFITKQSTAQQVTGTWEGTMDGNEFLQINVIQIGDKLCGYTWDFGINDSASFCKAYFYGSYNKLTDAWFLEGYEFMNNSGGHYLMQLKFKIVEEGKKKVMKGMCRIKPTLFFGGDIPSPFTLKKTSNRPTVITQTMKDCMAQFEPPKKPTIKKSSTSKKEIPVATNSASKKDSITVIPPLVEKIKDTVDKKPPTAIVNNSPKETNGRINKELSRIVVNDKKITLNIYDNGTIDGDTVSIFYNGKQIVKSKRLTANALVVDVTLDENTPLHSIVLFAENLGSIPPNTALVVFTTASGKRYQLFSSATLQQNAEIVFEYKDK